jgi:hypothetical protein
MYVCCDQGVAHVGVLLDALYQGVDHGNGLELTQFDGVLCGTRMSELHDAVWW